MQKLFPLFTHKHPFPFGLLIIPIGDAFLQKHAIHSENKVMHFKPLILRLALAMLAGVAVSCKDICFGIGIPVVDPLLIQPLVLKYLGIFEGMGIKGSCFQDYGRDRQQGLHKTDFPQMRVDFASHRR